MTRKRHFTLSILLLAVVHIPLSAAEKAPARLPAPLTAYASSTSPQRLLTVLDKLFLSILQGTENAGSYPPGMFPGMGASINIPSLFDNSKASIGFAMTVDKRNRPEAAFILSGVDRDAFLEELRRGGIQITDQEDSTLVDLTPIQRGLEAYLVDLDGARVILAETPASCRRFKRILERFDPDHPAGVDVTLVVDIKRIRDTFPEEIERYMDKVGELHPEQIEKALPREIDADLRAMLSRASAEVVQRFAPLPLEVDVIGLELSVNDDILELACTAAVQKDGALANLSERYRDKKNPDYTLTKTVSEDAIILSADAPTAGGLFPEGDVLATVASIYLGSLVPERAEQAAVLREAFQDNPVSEEVSGFYMRDGSLVRITFAKTGNGKKYIDSMVETAELADAALNRLSSTMPKGHRIRMTVDGAKAGKVAYKAIAPRIELQGDDPNLETVRDYVNEIGAYLASNKNTVMMVSGHGLSADILEVEAARLTPGIDDAMMEYDVAKDLVERLTKRQLGHCLYKPSDIFVYFTWYRLNTGLMETPSGFDADAFLDSLKNGGDLAGYSLGAVPGGLVLQLAIPLEAVNDFFVNIEKEQAIAKKTGPTPPSNDKNPAAGDEDMTGWDDDDHTDDDDGWGG